MLKMVKRGCLLPALALAALLQGCASVDEGGGSGGLSDNLGPGMEEFETQALGGTYRFQYVAETPESYRTVFWRQGELLSDDTKDAKLAGDVVRTVFNSRFCKDRKKPVVFADGSPAPLGKAGLWSAALKCAEPPPKPKEPKPEKAPAKKAPAAEPETASSPAAKSDTSASSSGEAKPKPKSTTSDAPMVCERVGDKFECKPKR